MRKRAEEAIGKHGQFTRSRVTCDALYLVGLLANLSEFVLIDVLIETNHELFRRISAWLMIDCLYTA
jgi:hypothetical protein